MQRTTVAIFGHYDSRGGSVAITLPDNPTEKDLEQAFREYNDTAGYNHDMTPEENRQVDYDYLQSEYGYTDEKIEELRERDTKWGPMHSPADTDFLHVAIIHHEVDLPNGELLWEYTDGDTESGFVVRERTKYDDMTEEERDAQSKRDWTEYEARAKAENELRESDRVAWIAKQQEEEFQRNLAESKTTLTNPEQLEYIPVDQEWVDEHKAIEARRNQRLEEAGVRGWRFNSTERENALRDQIEQLNDQENKEHEARLLSRAKIIKRPINSNYGEDACGLILM